MCILYFKCYDAWGLGHYSIWQMQNKDDPQPQRAHSLPTDKVYIRRFKFNEKASLSRETIFLPQHQTNWCNQIPFCHQSNSKIVTLDVRKADLGLFRDLLGREAKADSPRQKGPRESVDFQWSLSPALICGKSSKGGSKPAQANEELLTKLKM